MPSPSMPEYERLLLGANACGFVCCDLTADASVLASAETASWVEKAKFKDLRHYLHSLIRAERQVQKTPTNNVTPLHAALRNGVLARVCSRLRTEQSWRGLQAVEEHNVIPKEELVTRRLKRGDRYPDGRKVPPWRTYSPPPVYAREPRVLGFVESTRMVNNPSFLGEFLL